MFPQGLLKVAIFPGLKCELVVSLWHVKLDKRSLGDPIFSYELVSYPEVHAGSDHVRFKFLLVYSGEPQLWLNDQG